MPICKFLARVVVAATLIAAVVSPRPVSAQEDSWFFLVTPNGNRSSLNPSVSGDGNLVAFQSEATNLIDPDAPVSSTIRSNIFLWNRATGVTRQLTDGNGDSTNPTISADGSTIAFVSRASDIAPESRKFRFSTELMILDTATGQISMKLTGSNLDTRAAVAPGVSADGSRVVFNHGDDLYRWDRANNRTINIAPIGFEFKPKPSPAISGDGRYVVFSSSASELHRPGDGKYDQFLFAHDFDTGETFRVGGGNGYETDGDGSTIRLSTTDSGNQIGVNDSRGFRVIAGIRAPSSTDQVVDFSSEGVVSASGRRIAYFRGTLTRRFFGISDYPGTAIETPHGSDRFRSISLDRNGSFMAFSSPDEILSRDVTGYSDIYVWGESGPLPPDTPQRVKNAETIAELVGASDYDVRKYPPVLRLYRAIFAREPDVEGVKYWIRVLDGEEDGTEYGIIEIARFMSASAEWENNYAGTSPDQFVEIVYSNVLGRSYDQAGYNYWLDLVRGSNEFGNNPKRDRLTRPDMVFYVTDNEEFRNSYPYLP